MEKSKSITGILLALLYGLLTKMDKGELTITVFLDFKKAINTIDHEILMSKVEGAGLGLKTCTFLKNYLSNRSNIESTTDTVKS